MYKHISIFFVLITAPIWAMETSQNQPEKPAGLELVEATMTGNYKQAEIAIQKNADVNYRSGSLESPVLSVGVDALFEILRGERPFYDRYASATLPIIGGLLANQYDQAWVPTIVTLFYFLLVEGNNHLTARSIKNILENLIISNKNFDPHIADRNRVIPQHKIEDYLSVTIRTTPRIRKNMESLLECLIRNRKYISPISRPIPEGHNNHSGFSVNNSQLVLCISQEQATKLLRDLHRRAQPSSSNNSGHHQVHIVEEDKDDQGEASSTSNNQSQTNVTQGHND